MGANGTVAPRRDDSPDRRGHLSREDAPVPDAVWLEPGVSYCDLKSVPSAADDRDLASASDLSDEPWRLVEPLFVTAHQRGPRFGATRVVSSTACFASPTPAASGGSCPQSSGLVSVPPLVLERDLG